VLVRAAESSRMASKRQVLRGFFEGFASPGVFEGGTGVLTGCFDGFA
jgi:hypothetical protein